LLYEKKLGMLTAFMTVLPYASRSKYFSKELKMFKTCKAVIGTAVLALGLGVGAAQAAFIQGSITVADGLLGLPATPSTSVVSLLTGVQHDGFGNSSGCTTNFVGTCGFGNATMTNWVFAGPFPNIIVINGFTFDLTGHGAITPTALNCGVSGTCNDGLVIADLVGVVSKAGFDPTAFTGFLALSGTCAQAAAAGNVCGSDLSGGYTYSLSAVGRSTVPEPATLLLFGIALAGLGVMRRKNT
jgi:PEP-CTERM motif